METFSNNTEDYFNGIYFFHSIIFVILTEAIPAESNMAPV